MPEALEQLRANIERDDVAAVRDLLQTSPALRSRLNGSVGGFDSPAILCARSPQMLDALLEAGADINARSRWWAGGFGILDRANPEVAAHALRRGARVDVHSAARLGLVDRVRELIAGNSELVHARGGDGQTPLHFASTVEIAEFLLDQGADIDARDIDHESTPAQYMVRDRQDVARFLLQRGCRSDLLLASAVGDIEKVRHHLDTDPRSIRMRVTEEFFPRTHPHAGGTIYQWTLAPYATPHQVARMFQHLDVLEFLRERSPVEILCLDACCEGDESLVRELTAKHQNLAGEMESAYPNEVAVAARLENLPAVRLLLSLGFSVRGLGQHRGTPLHWAAFHGNLEMVNEILRYDPPLDLKDADFASTPLEWAIHGSEFGWHPDRGDYAGTVERLAEVGSPRPRKFAGSSPVREVLRRKGWGD